MGRVSRHEPSRGAHARNQAGEQIETSLVYVRITRLNARLCVPRFLSTGILRVSRVQAALPRWRVKTKVYGFFRISVPYAIAYAKHCVKYPLFSLFHKHANKISSSYRRAHGTPRPHQRDSIYRSKPFDISQELHKTRVKGESLRCGVRVGCASSQVCKVWGAEALSMARRRAVVCRSGSMTALYYRGLCRSQAVPDHRMGAARQFRVTVQGSLARPTARLLAAWWWPYGRPMVALWSPGAARRAGYSGGGMPSSSMKARKNPAWL